MEPVASMGMPSRSDGMSLLGRIPALATRVWGFFTIVGSPEEAQDADTVAPLARVKVHVEEQNKRYYELRQNQQAVNDSLKREDTLKKQIFKKLAFKYLCDARQEVKNRVSDEIEATWAHR